MDFYKERFDVSQWDNIKVPANWEVEGYDHPVYLDEKYPFDTKWPDAPQEYNPVGSYKRNFEIPTNWNGREIFIHLGAVNSAFFIWINGKQVGYSEDSKTPAEFNITKYVKPGSNSVALQVFRWSDGRYLEAQDMLKVSGIERDIYLFATPKIHVYDFFCKAGLDDTYSNGTIDLTVQLRNHTEQTGKYVVDVSLLDDAQNLKSIWGHTQAVNIASKKPNSFSIKQSISAPRKWTAETPELYTLIISVKNNKGETVEVISDKIGFRKVEIKNSRLLINGKAIKIKGVNRHESHGIYGHYYTLIFIRRCMPALRQ